MLIEIHNAIREIEDEVHEVEADIQGRLCLMLSKARYSRSLCDECSQLGLCHDEDFDVPLCISCYFDYKTALGIKDNLRHCLWEIINA